MTLPIARDLGRGIRVNTILPGIFNTPLLAGAAEREAPRWARRCPSPSVWAIRKNMRPRDD
jgi:NAD(P)-dependent dehydrogenase (short-subunit alcohol dehydrogenase family)